MCKVCSTSWNVSQTVEKANRALVAECRNAVSQRANALESSLSNFHSAEGRFHPHSGTALRRWSALRLRSTTSSSSSCNQLKKISTSLREVRSGQMESKDVLAALLGDLDATVGEMQATSEASLGSLKETCRGAITMCPRQHATFCAGRSFARRYDPVSRGDIEGGEED